jgi:hypothetical protein
MFLNQSQSKKKIRKRRRNMVDPVPKLDLENNQEKKIIKKKIKKEKFLNL